MRCLTTHGSVMFAITIVIHKSRNLIGPLGSSEFEPKQCQVFHSNIVSLEEILHVSAEEV